MLACHHADDFGHFKQAEKNYARQQETIRGQTLLILIEGVALLALHPTIK